MATAAGSPALRFIINGVLRTPCTARNPASIHQLPTRRLMGLWSGPNGIPPRQSPGTDPSALGKPDLDAIHQSPPRRERAGAYSPYLTLTLLPLTRGGLPWPVLAPRRLPDSLICTVNPYTPDPGGFHGLSSPRGGCPTVSYVLDPYTLLPLSAVRGTMAPLR